MMPEHIGFDQTGLANILRHNWLQVPLNQREYSWTDREVTNLLHDFSFAIDAGESEYFLGTIVTIPREGDILEVVDGQQRLATTVILLAAIRDFMEPREGQVHFVEDIGRILVAIDRAQDAEIPRLKLNVTDGTYFQRRVLEATPDTPRSAVSHDLIHRAAELAAEHVTGLVSTHDPKNYRDVFNNWVTFLEKRAVVVLLTVPNERNVYKMFETLNDRGLKTSQSDLVKNYLFGQSDDRLPEAQEKWASMRAVLESFEDDDITVNYLRQMLISMYGYRRESEVYETVQNMANSRAQAFVLLDSLDSGATDYAAILNPEHEKWNTYPPAIRRAIETLLLLPVRPTRPLMLSIARGFTPGEATKAFQLLISLSVRFLIVGGARSGRVEKALAASAKKVSGGLVTTAEEMLASLDDVVPKDKEFEVEFANVTVSTAKLARYYLRSLEFQVMSISEPWFVPNDNPQTINLEHVLPRKPEDNWPQFSAEDVPVYYRRIGNLALLQASNNSTLKSAPFTDKKPILAGSPYELTRQIANVEDWTPETIVARQQTMARFAPDTWPLTITTRR